MNAGRAARHAARSDVHALALIALALAVWLPLGIERTPMQGDRAFFTYMGQTVLRGESIYAVDFMGYPPIGPLLSAAAMSVGRAVGIPTYLTPRYAAVGVALLCVIGVQLLTRRATQSAWAGLASGIVMIGFERWGWSSLATLEPKMLVVFFSTAACLALQASRPFTAGVAGALAVGCYQPTGVIVPAALAASVCWESRRASRCAGRSRSRARSSPGISRSFSWEVSASPPSPYAPYAAGPSASPMHGWRRATEQYRCSVSGGRSGAAGPSRPRSTSSCSCPSWRSGAGER
jgi:hypothetical protein